jgi:mono/diheme cytochrome c family protein
MKAGCVSMILALCMLACGSPPPATSRTETSAADAPGRGHALFLAKCNQCHAYPQPTNYTATQWKRILVEMGRRASLTRGEREQVLQYILSTPGVPEAN